MTLSRGLCQGVDSVQGVSVKELSLSRGSLSRDLDPSPVDRMTHTYENITLPQTSFTGGNKVDHEIKKAFIFMQRWTADFCRADTDEDGKTNGEELGDPDCVWSEGGTPARTTDITHPGTYHNIHKKYHA